MSEKFFDTGIYDTIAGDSSIRVFGRLTWDIILREDVEKRNEAYAKRPGSTGPVPPRLSENNLLIEQLCSEHAKLARISCFSYQNEMFDLAKPAIFLVHGEGTRVEFSAESGASGLVLRKSPPYTELSGMVGQKGSFAPDIFMWVYDRADFTVRLDTETGSFDQVLLAFELGGPVDNDFMESAGTDPPRPRMRARRRRRRWRSDEE